MKSITEHPGDMLLDAANILDWQRQMILTSTRNNTEFDKIETALLEQMGNTHEKEKRHEQKTPPTTQEAMALQQWWRKVPETVSNGSHRWTR